MSRYLFLSLSLFLPLAQAAAQAPPHDAHDLAYSLGASLGERLRDEVPDLQIQALVEGLKAAYQGKPLALKSERIEQLLAQHEAQISEQSARWQIETALENERRFLDQEKAKP
ncbi:FKBP-type peptidyl-prolyl cis-trans isomerase, partial [Pseudomonas sp. MWU13-2625]